MGLLTDTDLRFDRDPEQVRLDLGHVHAAPDLGQFGERRPLLPIRRYPLPLVGADRADADRLRVLDAAGLAYPHAFSLVQGRSDRTDNSPVRLGIADHLGWAIAVTASDDHEVVDRRRLQLIEPGVSEAPIHHESARLDVADTASLVTKARASIARASSAALDELAGTLAEPLESISLRVWPLDFPEDIAVQRRVPYEARADAIMYRQELSELAHARGWEVHLYDAKAVVDQATRLLGERADEVLNGPRTTLGPPWTKDHRVALAATIVAH